MFQYHCLNPIAEKGLGLFDEEYKKSEDLQECDAVLVRSAKMHDMELPESVKVIARAGAGVNNIPVKDCAEKGVVVFNTPGANANGVKELVLAGMLLASRDIVGGIEWVAKEKDQEDIDKLAEKQKKQFAGCEIMGKKLGIIGLGAIGAMVANAASALGMEAVSYTHLFGLYEPSHGSAPDIAGQDKANPIATILSAAMMLRFSLDMDKEADAVEAAVQKVLTEGYRTGDIMSEGCKLVGTKEMGDLIAVAL